MKAAACAASVSLQGCLETCRQSERLVRLCIDVPKAQDVFRGIGPQLCHCLDHYRSLLAGLVSGTIDYDGRVMDPSMETESEIFLDALCRVTAELTGLEGISTTQAIDVVQTIAPAMQRVVAGSTLERELAFLSSHTLHHLDLVVEIAAGHGVKLASDR
jgi:hypothetical protein